MSWPTQATSSATRRSEYAWSFCRRPLIVASYTRGAPKITATASTPFDHGFCARAHACEQRCEVPRCFDLGHANRMLARNGETSARGPQGQLEMEPLCFLKVLDHFKEIAGLRVAGWT